MLISYPISLNNWAISLKLPISIGTTIVTLLVLISFFGPSVSSTLSPADEESSSRVQKYSDAIELVQKGNGLNAIGRYQEAIEFFDRAIAIGYPAGERLALGGKGTALIGLGRHQEAVEQFDRALSPALGVASAPVTYSLYNNKGLASFELGRYQESIEQYDKALVIIEEWSNTAEECCPERKRFRNIDAYKFEPLNNRGVALSALGRYQESIEQYDKALAIFPTDINALINKGNALSALGRYQEAIEQYDKALGAVSVPSSYKKPDKSIENVQYFATDLKRENGIVMVFKTRPTLSLDGQEESNQLQHIAFVTGQEAVIIVKHSLGINLYETKRFNDANRKFDEVLRIDSNFAPGLFYKGLCLEKLGQVDGAIPYMQKAHEIDPTYKGERIDITLIQIPNLPIEEFVPRP